MNVRKVLLSPRAEADLDAIGDWISEAGAPLTALDYVRRIRRFIAGFDQFPERGTNYDGIRLGLRAVGFERRAMIIFVVRNEWIEIERVLYGGREWRRILRAGNLDS